MSIEVGITSQSPKTSSSRFSAWGILRVSLGVLLLVAAGSKLYGMNVSAVPQIGWFATTTMQLVAAEWELILGVWLLSGKYQVGAWIAALWTFTAFAGISAYFGWIGVATCGCFGPIPTSPWWVFALDAGVMIVLGLLRPNLGRPGRLTWAECRSIAVTGLQFALSLAGLLAATAVAGGLAYGSLEGAMARLRGEAISVQPSYLDFGVVEPGQIHEKTVRVQNWTNRPVRLIGARSAGPCILTDSMPIVIGQGEACSITVRLRLGSQSDGMFLTSGEIWADADGVRIAPILIGCRVKSTKAALESSNPQQVEVVMERLCMLAAKCSMCVVAALMVLALSATPTTVLADVVTMVPPGGNGVNCQNWDPTTGQRRCDPNECYMAAPPLGCAMVQCRNDGFLPCKICNCKQFNWPSPPYPPNLITCECLD